MWHKYRHKNTHNKMRSHQHIYLSCILITESKLFIIYYHYTELYIITHTNHCTGYNSIKYMRMDEWGIKEVELAGQIEKLYSCMFTVHNLNEQI